MGALAVTNSFSAGTTIVAADMNQNFDDIEAWVAATPTLGASGTTVNVAGNLTVDQLTVFTGLSKFHNNIELQGVDSWIGFEGASADDYETFLKAAGPTADRTITLPDATGTVALTSDITGTVWDDQSNILANSVFN